MVDGCGWTQVSANLVVVIPAKAGIHCAVAFLVNGDGKVKMDPGFRRDDDREGYAAITSARAALTGVT